MRCLMWPEDTTPPPSTLSERTENETSGTTEMTVTRSESRNETDDKKTSEITLLVRRSQRLSRMPWKRLLILILLCLIQIWFGPSMTLPLE